MKPQKKIKCDSVCYHRSHPLFELGIWNSLENLRNENWGSNIKNLKVSNVAECVSLNSHFNSPLWLRVCPPPHRSCEWERPRKLPSLKQDLIKSPWQIFCIKSFIICFQICCHCNCIFKCFGERSRTQPSKCLYSMLRKGKALKSTYLAARRAVLSAGAGLALSCKMLRRVAKSISFLLRCIEIFKSWALGWVKNACAPLHKNYPSQYVAKPFVVVAKKWAGRVILRRATWIFLAAFHPFSSPTS